MQGTADAIMQGTAVQVGPGDSQYMPATIRRADQQIGSLNRNIRMKRKVFGV